MLQLESPIFFLNQLEIHRDFQNPNQFYYFPTSPRIHRDPNTGKPAFKLLKYARDITQNTRFPPGTKEQLGGGFLTMTVDIGVDDDVIKDTAQKLAAYADGQVNLTPVPFHTGAVRLVALGAEGGRPGQPPAQPTNTFVETIFGATTPSLYSDNQALFGAHLSQEGVTLVEKSFEQGGGLIGVIYDLIYTGMRPSLQVKAEVDYSRVYDRFEAQIGFQYAMIGVELDATLEFLREQGAITIEITQFDPEAGADSPLRKEAMDLVKSEIIAKMFKPSLQLPTASTRSGGGIDQVSRVSRDLSQPPSNTGGQTGPNTAAADPTPPAANEGDRGPRAMEGRSPAQGAASGTGGSSGTPGFALSFTLKFVHQDERHKATFDFRANQAVNRNASPQGSLSLLTSQLVGDDLKQLIQDVNLDDPFFRELGASIAVVGDWQELGIDRVVVNATYQPVPTGPIVHTDGWTFSAPAEPARPFNVLLDRDNPVRKYAYETQVFLRDLSNVDSKQRVLVKRSETELPDLVIQPANEFKPLIVSVEPGRIDWTKVNQVDVSLRYADPENQFEAQQLFSFRADRAASQKWIVYPVDPNLRTYEVTFAYHLADPQSTFFRLPPVSQTDEAVVVQGPFKGVRSIRLLPAFDSEELNEVTAELVFEKSGYRFFKQETFTADDLKARSIDIPNPDPDPASDTYQVRWTVVDSGFNVVDYSWQTRQSQKCVISDGIHSVETVKLVFDRTVEQAGLLSVVVTLESLDQAGEVIDSDVLITRARESELETELLVLQGQPLRYRYQLKKNTAGGSNVVSSSALSNRKVVVEL